jgi:hypothetical protein
VGYVADNIPKTIALPPKSLTKNTRKGKTILKPRVPIKLISNMGELSDSSIHLQRLGRTSSSAFISILITSESEN